MLKLSITHHPKPSCVLLFLFLVVLLLYHRLEGRCFVVLSGSMEPYLQTGSMIFTLPNELIITGDVITFQKQGTVITHRVVGQTQEGYITKGDANPLADAGTVFAPQIIGRVFFHIPYLGYLISFLQAFPLLFILMCLLAASISKIRRKENTQKRVSKIL